MWKLMVIYLLNYVGVICSLTNWPSLADKNETRPYQLQCLGCAKTYVYLVPRTKAEENQD